MMQIPYERYQRFLSLLAEPAFDISFVEPSKRGVVLLPSELRSSTFYQDLLTRCLPNEFSAAITDRTISGIDEAIANAALHGNLLSKKMSVVFAWQTSQVGFTFYVQDSAVNGEWDPNTAFGQKQRIIRQLAPTQDAGHEYILSMRGTYAALVDEGQIRGTLVRLEHVLDPDKHLLFYDAAMKIAVMESGRVTSLDNISLYECAATKLFTRMTNDSLKAQRSDVFTEHLTTEQTHDKSGLEPDATITLYNASDLLYCLQQSASDKRSNPTPDAEVQVYGPYLNSTLPAFVNRSFKYYQKFIKDEDIDVRVRTSNIIVVRQISQNKPAQVYLPQGSELLSFREGPQVLAYALEIANHRD